MNLIDNYKHKGQRKKLIEILIKKGIKQESVLEAINSVPRHIFFDQALESHAYEDKAFPIGEGQTISQPYTVARQTELLQVRPGAKILEIGTGSGYQGAVLCAMGAKLFTIERHKPLHMKAKAYLNSLGMRPTLICGDGTKGLPSYMPFDGIIVTAGAPNVPNSLINQLKIGGVLVIPVGDQKSQKMLQIIRTSETEVITHNYGDFAFVPLIGENAW